MNQNSTNFWLQEIAMKNNFNLLFDKVVTNRESGKDIRRKVFSHYYYCFYSKENTKISRPRSDNFPDSIVCQGKFEFLLKLHCSLLGKFVNGSCLYICCFFSDGCVDKASRQSSTCFLVNKLFLSLH